MSEEIKTNADGTVITGAQSVETNEPVAKELAETKKRLEQAEYTIVKLKKAPVSPSETHSQTVDIESIKAEAAKAAKAEIDSIRQDLTGDVLEEELSKVAKTPEERAAVLREYNEGIVKTGVSRAKIGNDLARAALLANGPKLQAQMSEVQRAATASGTAMSGSATGTSAEIKANVKFTPAEEKWVTDTARVTGKTVDEVKTALLKNRR